MNAEAKPSTLPASLSFPPVQEEVGSGGLPRASLLLAFADVGYSIQSLLCSLAQPPSPTLTPTQEGRAG